MATTCWTCCMLKHDTCIDTAAQLHNLYTSLTEMWSLRKSFCIVCIKCIFFHTDFDTFLENTAGFCAIISWYKEWSDQQMIKNRDFYLLSTTVNGYCTRVYLKYLELWYIKIFFKGLLPLICIKSLHFEIETNCTQKIWWIRQKVSSAFWFSSLSLVRIHPHSG